MGKMSNMRAFEKLNGIPNLDAFGQGQPGCEATKGVPLKHEYEGDGFNAKLDGDWHFDEVEGGASSKSPGYWIRLGAVNIQPGPAMNERAKLFYWFNYGELDNEELSPKDEKKALKAAAQFADLLKNMGVASDADLDADTYEEIFEKFVEKAMLLEGKVGNGSFRVEMGKFTNDAGETVEWGPKLKMGYMSPSDLEPETPGDMPF